LADPLGGYLLDAGLLGDCHQRVGSPTDAQMLLPLMLQLPLSHYSQLLPYVQYLQDADRVFLKSWSV